MGGLQGKSDSIFFLQIFLKTNLICVMQSATESNAIFQFFQCLDGCDLVYFGGMTYRGSPVPTIGSGVNSVWVKYGDEKDDIHRDGEYILDSQLTVTDVCYLECEAPGLLTNSLSAFIFFFSSR